MYPILLQIGRVTIYSYGVTLAIAFILSVHLATKRAAIFGLNGDSINNLAFILLISGIIGARAFYVFLNFGYFIKRPIEIFMLHRGGLVFYGAFIIALAFGIVYAKIKKIPILDTADLIAPFVALAHSIGRIGCFLNGCCYGKPTDSFLGISPSLHSVIKLWPTQIISSLGTILIFFVLFFIQKRRTFKGQIISLYFILYGIFRFSIDFLRDDLYSVFYQFTSTQLISIGFIIAGTAFYAYRKRRD